MELNKLNFCSLTKLCFEKAPIAFKQLKFATPVSNVMFKHKIYFLHTFIYKVYKTIQYNEINK